MLLNAYSADGTYWISKTVFFASKLVTSQLCELRVCLRVDLVAVFLTPGASIMSPGDVSSLGIGGGLGSSSVSESIHSGESAVLLLSSGGGCGG